jgi:hypothetical protein
MQALLCTDSFVSLFDEAALVAVGDKDCLWCNGSGMDDYGPCSCVEEQLAKIQMKEADKAFDQAFDAWLDSMANS